MATADVTIKFSEIDQVKAVIDDLTRQHDAAQAYLDQMHERLLDLDRLLLAAASSGNHIDGVSVVKVPAVRAAMGMS